LKLIDTHAHLEEVLDVHSMIRNARAVGVDAIIGVGTNLDSCKRTLELSREHADLIYPAIGVHPQEIGKDLADTLLFIEEHLHECVAVGEVGLDYWSKIDKGLQNEVFSKMLSYAESSSLPLSIHSRGAWKECYESVLSRQISKAVFHWFSGPVEILKQVLDSGYYVSASPALEYSKAHRASIKETPLEALVIETDSPVNYHGKKSEPSDVVKTLRFLAELKGLSQEEVASTTTRNAIRLFNLRHV
jgi:TatD DNase family protein